MSDQSDASPAMLPGQPAAADRRVAVRYSCTVKSLCQTKTARAEDFWWWGKIQDISTGGVGLLIRRPFELGTLLVIEPFTGQEGFEPLQVRVVRAIQQAQGGWLLGCEFASPSASQSQEIANLLPALASAEASNGFDAA